ncbi:hypothetical protein TIFTF001_033008 [Ficus carica]|uniref:Uncharacterized protein n=1 Tax=Ficus carica TaxID=3494 RepID=A0AA88DYD2_FICCA|nr:hypothetical protein TIFTF001_033008 [Ficus carica]
MAAREGVTLAAALGYHGWILESDVINVVRLIPSTISKAVELAIINDIIDHVTSLISVHGEENK